VVASLAPLIALVTEGDVSIPFIAGQWSLRGEHAFSRRRAGGGFNPLHCGAVVASGGRRPGAARRRHVSIPFIAGQWSLHIPVPDWWTWDDEFQSPSLRGSGRFRGRLPRHDVAGGVSIPFIAGQWSLPSSGEGPRAGEGVSIPFIAGQWSLPWTRTSRAARESRFQSPSLRGSGRFARAKREIEARAAAGFNPLHCGAVVAS